MSNITQVVNTDKNLKSLKKGVHASDLDQLLSSTGPFTFFAPSDLAFDKLPEGTLAGLLEPAKKQDLTDLLNHHIVKGRIAFDDLKEGDQLETLSGKALAVSVGSDGAVTIGDAKIVARDQKVSNGIIHLTDSVLAN